MQLKKLIVFGLILMSFIACNSAQSENKIELIENDTIEDIVEKENLTSNEYIDSMVKSVLNETNNQFIICCPYCIAEITDVTTFCSHCRLDTRNDAAIEMSSYDHSIMEKKTCQHCALKVPKDAFYCMHCKEKL